jgi:Mg-chelatase subunit ChlD
MIIALNTEVTLWKDESDPSEGDDNKGSEKGESRDNGEDADDQEGDDSEEGDADGDNDSDDGDSKGEESSGDDGDGSEDEGEDPSDGSGGDEDAGEDDNGSPSGKDGDSGSGDGDSDPQDGNKDGDCRDSSEGTEEDGLPEKDLDDHSAGGYDPNEAKTLAEKLMEGWEDGDEDGLKDNNSALEGAIQAAEEEAAQAVRPGEQLWRSPHPTLDTMSYASKSAKDAGRALRAQARSAASAIQSKLRNKLLQARARHQVHGVRRGRGLSSRRLVNTMTEIRSQRRPTRPDWKNHTRPDVTLSAALVLDQSGSMARLTRNAALGAFALGDALTPLGCPTLIIGPRDERRRYSYGAEVSPNAHRHYPVHIDIFKDWGEDMGAAQERIPSVRATGGTPLSDGIQMALLELQERTENHRVIFVLTDGEPNRPRVVNRQIRLAREAGIHVVGVGIGAGARAVKTQFPDAYVSVRNISELAPALVNVLLGLIFPKNASTKKNFSWG